MHNSFDELCNTLDSNDFARNGGKVVFYTSNGEKHEGNSYADVDFLNLDRPDGPALYIYYNTQPATFTPSTCAYALNGNILDTDKIMNWLAENNIDLSSNFGRKIFMLKFGGLNKHEVTDILATVKRAKLLSWCF